MHTITIGTPALDQYGTSGFVAAIEKPEASGFTIGGSGLQRTREAYLICWESGRTSKLPDSIARPFFDRAAAANLPLVDDVDERRARIERMEADASAARMAEAEAARQRVAEFRADAVGRVPSCAQAVIVAELIQDDSDSMSDYYGSKTLRTVILAFSKHKRDLFPELRKAAATFPETAELAAAPESAEHREKYSMGGGYYLKAGFRHSSGWQVRKVRLYQGAESVPFGEWHLAEDVAAAAPIETPAGIRIEEHTHTKKGFQMFVAVLADRVERDEFERLRDRAESLGGWYSRPWGKTPGGFAFRDRASAEVFAGARADTAPAADAPAARGNDKIAEKFRAMADKLESEIAGKFADRRTNTPKQQREAASARMDGWHLTRTRDALRALADMHEAGTVPVLLARLTSKAAIHELTRSCIDRSGAGYYDAGIDTNKPANNTEEARALWVLLGGKSAADVAAEELRTKVEALKLARIPGYFPTPAPIVADMLEAADMPAGPCRVLEPSAGSGAILDGIAAAYPQAHADAFECWLSLRDVLKLKGANLIGDDFTEPEPTPVYDRVLMNPPFEKGQDMLHVRIAFSWLKPGGRLVAIMSTGPFFRSDAKARAFRDWFEELGGCARDLPAGSFKESGTGVGVSLVILDKSEA
ncbi:DNA methyltransferase family protein [Mangrovibrevibacter kandeliae]|uniref:class I SAM-dependent methyltransferase n=1 Tax=Mangrovibrevibacter kandeliae TaxID=2968473 RepID=UPI002117C6BB|nr:class I SAM-dependent methyltransferase [Aurantimonas sp. CSK15Z-1]MCQ8781695.1 class I SAM-dependent methyltransferase [Aurantimonas sp. CSK15Z-1]